MMDGLSTSLNSSSEFDSPNTKERKRFRVVGGDMTDQERSFLLRNGFLEVDEVGEYHEVSTIIDTDAETDEDDENVDPTWEKNKNAAENVITNMRSSTKSAVEDNLGMLFHRCTRSSDSGVGSRVLSPLAVNSNPDSSLKDEIVSEKATDSEDDVIPPSKNEELVTENSDEQDLCSVQSAEKKCRQSVDVASQEAHSPLPQDLRSADTDLISINDSVDAKIAQLNGPKASPNKLDGSSSSPSCSEIEITSSNRLCFETPLPGASTGMRPRIRDYSYDVSTPANGNPAAFMFSPDDDQSLLSIQCPATYSSSSDVDTPQSRSGSVHPVQALFSNQLSFGSFVTRNQSEKKTELMDISIGDVADIIAANESDASVPGNPEISMEKNLSVDRVETVNSVVNSSMPPEILEEILDLEDNTRLKPFPDQFQNQPYITQTCDDETVEELASSITESKGIDAVSPVTVAVDISLTDTSDSFAEISLDDISNASFHLNDTEDEEVMEKDTEGPNDSFRTCVSVASTASYNSCDDNDQSVDQESMHASEAKSLEELDDTITIMEKLLLEADELEQKEAQECANSPGQSNTPRMLSQGTSSMNTVDTPPIFATPKSPVKNSTTDTNLFATPTGPAPRSKRLSVSRMESHYFSPNSKPVSPALPPTPPRAAPIKPPSPMKNEAPAPRIKSPKSPSPKSKVTPTRRLKTILDSPRQAAAVPKIAVTPRLPNATNRKPIIAHPIASPVANYIYSVPPPVAVQRMIPPPKLHASSPRKTNPDTKIPKPKLTLPRSENFDSSIPTVAGKKPGRETISSLLPEKNSKELASNVHYVGPDSVKAVNNSFTTPSKPYSSANVQGVTPVTQRHLGVRDINNASMVAQQHVPRKFCPERFGFRSQPTTPRSGK